MNPLRVVVIGNLSDRRCGFQNFTQQTLTALARAGARADAFDGSYPLVYQRREIGLDPFFPPRVEAYYDVIHLVWNAMTMNHYSGARWAELAALPGGGPIISWWDGGPSDASCPFLEWMQVRWSDYPRAGYHHLDYPVPDWVEDLPPTAEEFTVGASSVRGDGVAEIQTLCEARGWAMNLPTPGAWLSVEDEVRRLARSSVNVCWYNTPPLWHNRASAPSMLLAAGRPLVINQDPLVAHLWDWPESAGIYHGRRPPHWAAAEGGLGPTLDRVYRDWQHGSLSAPTAPGTALSWTHATDRLQQVWQAARLARSQGVA